MTRGARAGLGVLDVVLSLALLALLIYVLRLDWRRHERPRPGSVPGPTGRV